MAQTYTSAKTSLNQIPAIHRWAVRNKPMQNVLDYGGGKFNRAVEFLENSAPWGTAPHVAKVYDPFNRDDAYNASTMAWVSSTNVDTVILANVLNVIDDEAALIETVRKCLAISDNAKGSLLISVYVGNGSGIGCQTRCGYQRNESAGVHRDRLVTAYPNHHVSMRAGYIIMIANSSLSYA